MDLWICGWGRRELGFVDSWICGLGRRGRLFVRGGLGFMDSWICGGGRRGLGFVDLWMGTQRTAFCPPRTRRGAKKSSGGAGFVGAGWRFLAEMAVEGSVMAGGIRTDVHRWRRVGGASWASSVPGLQRILLREVRGRSPERGGLRCSRPSPGVACCQSIHGGAHWVRERKSRTILPGYQGRQYGLREVQALHLCQEGCGTRFHRLQKC